MPYVLRPERLGAGATTTHLDFLETWINVLESRTSMQLGPAPLSRMALLESLVQPLTLGYLRQGTLARQLGVALAAAQSSRWLRAVYPGWAHLCSTLAQAATAPGSGSFRTALTEISAVLCHMHDVRVSSHVDFIASREEPQHDLTAVETADLVSDLIALGHSESFLYGVARFAPEEGAPAESIAEKLARFRELGRSRSFSVAFRVFNPKFIPHSDCVYVGKRQEDEFPSLAAWELGPSETLALVKVTAADYKAAIRRARAVFVEHLRSLSQSRSIARVQARFDQFKVKCHFDDTELVVDANVLKDYEQPTLIAGNAVWLCRRSAPEAASTLEQARYWLMEAGKARGPARFLDAWLALVTLFEVEDVEQIARLLARYRSLAKAQLLATWCCDYLGKLLVVRPSPTTEALARRLRLRSPLPQRLRPLVQAALSLSSDPGVTATVGPLATSRIRELAWLSQRRTRLRIQRRHEREVRSLLPWVKTIRHSVAHFGFVAVTALDLATQHLLEDVANVFDQVASSTLGGLHKRVGTIHAELLDDFDSLMDATLQEHCLSPLHVRQGLNHGQAEKRKAWHALRPKHERRR